MGAAAPFGLLGGRDACQSPGNLGPESAWQHGGRWQPARGLGDRDRDMAGGHQGQHSLVRFDFFFVCVC